VGHVVLLLRYPLKSARGEQLRAVRVDVEGVRGDRSWPALTRRSGTVGSAKHPERWGRLLEVTAQVDEHSSEVAVQVQGRRAVAGSEQADALLSRHLGRPVRLTRRVPDQARLHRRLPEEQGLVPDWMTGAVPGQELVTSCPVPGQAAASWTSGRCTCSPLALLPSSPGNSSARAWTNPASGPTSSSRHHAIRCQGRC